MRRILKAIATWLIFILAFQAAPGFAQLEQSIFSKIELEQLVAPIALYPDPLLAQVLMASTYPLEVGSAASWRKANPNLEGKALEKALEQQPWDPSIKSLIALPDVLNMMNEKLDMTQKLGDAFLSQQKDVLGAIQALRTRAHGQGNLKSSQEQTIQKTVKNGISIITINPTDSEIIYVPIYDPNFVYGTWPHDGFPPYYYYPKSYVPGTALLSFDIGTPVGHALWGDCNWHDDTLNIDVTRYNKFNNTSVNDINWQHNLDHRRGVPYRNNQLQQKYAGYQLQGIQSRKAFRGFQQTMPVAKASSKEVRDSQQLNVSESTSEPQVSQPIQRLSVFDDINRAAQTRIFSHRGAFSRGGMNKARFSGGIR
jgi:hypothetical protein